MTKGRGVMARPLKDGADYFPLDVGFLQDKKIKLLKSEFGLNCIAVIIAIFEAVFGRDGYFLKWDDDECYMMSEGVGSVCTPDYIKEVLNGCIRRSLFDERVFNMFGVITSRGIQRRYLKIFERREEIVMFEEYLLLDLSNKKDISTSILDKLTLKAINVCNNTDKCNINDGESNINALKKRKEKESKVKEPKDKNFTPPTLKEIADYCKQRKNSVDPQKFFDYFDVADWVDSKGNKVKNWKQKIITWEKNSSQQDAKNQTKINPYSGYRDLGEC